MLVQRVVMPGGGPQSWTVLDDTGEVVEPVERYLAYLSAIERSPNTVRAYAISLKLWFDFLDSARLAWDQVGIEDVARFVAWLRARLRTWWCLQEKLAAGARRRSTATWLACSAFTTTIPAEA